MADELNAPAPTTPAPAASAAAPAPTPSEGLSRESAVDKATREALANIKSTGSAAPQAAAEPAAPAPEKGRRPDGTIRPGPAKNAPELPDTTGVIADDVDEGEPQAGLEPSGKEKTAEGTQDQDEDEEAPDAQAGGEEAGAGDELTVVIPGRNEDEEFPITVDDPIVAERLRQLSNGFMRGEQARAIVQETEQKAAEIYEFEDMISADPAGVVLRVLDGNEPALLHLAKYLVTRPEIWQKLSPTIMQFDDPQVFELAQARTENERGKLRDSYIEESSSRREVAENLSAIQAAIAAVIPTDMPEAQQAMFYRDALRDVGGYAERNNRKTVSLSDLPLVLASRMTAAGINPVEAAKLMSGAGQRGRSSSENKVATGKPGAKAAAAAPQKPQRTGKDFVAARARKGAVAAAVPGAGAGAASTSLAAFKFDPSKGTSAIEQATEHHKRLLAQNRSSAR